MDSQHLEEALKEMPHYGYHITSISHRINYATQRQHRCLDHGNAGASTGSAQASQDVSGDDQVELHALAVHDTYQIHHQPFYR